MRVWEVYHSEPIGRCTEVEAERVRVWEGVLIFETGAKETGPRDLPDYIVAAFAPGEWVRCELKGDE